MAGKRTFVGIISTLLYVLIFGLYVNSKWPSEGMKLNEFGDMLAGFVGPVAFFWLVLGYFQQGEELKANGEALKQQAEELNKSVAEQRAQAEAIKRQVAQDREYYEHLRISSEVQQRELLKSQQPILNIASRDTVWAGGILKTTITLRNIGASCTFISAKIHTIDLIKATEYSSRHLETGGSVEILHLIFNKRHVSGTISIFYLDAMQRQGRIELRFTNDGDFALRAVGDEIDIAESDWGKVLSRQLLG